MTHKHSDLSCLSKVPIFSDLNDSDQDQISNIIRPIFYKKDEFVQLAGQVDHRLLVLSRGQAKVFRTSEDGRQQIVRLLSPGDYIGELTVFTNQPALNDIQALTDSAFCTIDSSDLHKILGSNSRLSTALLADLSTRLQQFESKVESFGLQTASQKVASKLIHLSDGKSELRLTTTKKDMASHLGITPETLSRKLTELQTEGAIKVLPGRSILITNIDKLRQIAT